MIFEGDVEFVGESVDDGGADAKAGKRAGAGHEGDFFNILPGLMIFLEFFMDELQ